MKEMELRIIDINVDEIRNKMKSLGLPKVKEENQVNYIYDFSDKKLLNNKGYARIRTVDDVLNNKKINYMTVKKLISNEKYKVMEEHETEVLDYKKAQEIFKALGLILIESIEKYRESYKYKNTLIEIDINNKEFCPFPYIEIESFYEDEIKEVVNILGYSMEDTTSKTIYEILENKGAIKGL